MTGLRGNRWVARGAGGASLLAAAVMMFVLSGVLFVMGRGG